MVDQKDKDGLCALIQDGRTFELAGDPLVEQPKTPLVQQVQKVPKQLRKDSKQPAKMAERTTKKRPASTTTTTTVELGLSLKH